MTEPAFFDLSWLAVPNGVDRGFLAALGLTDLRVVSWTQGLGAVTGDFWDPDAPSDANLSRVLVVEAQAQDQSPWTLLIGGWFGDDGRATRVLDACIEASRVRGAAFAFTTQGRMDWYAFAAAHNGELTRRFVWEGDVVIDEGERLPEEDWDEEEASRERTVGTLASRCAAGPRELPSFGPDGVLAVTAWGREHGVPSRSLGD